MPTKKQDKQRINVGARILDKEILKKFLPTVENLKSQINEFRKQAYNKSELINRDINCNKIKTKNTDYDIQYDNVISILGQRGTGKTSVLLTIKHDIEMENGQCFNEGIKCCYRNNVNILKDIVLPLIVPEDMSEVSDTLGWIISCFNSEVERLSKFLRSYDEGYDKNCEYVKNEVFEKCILNRDKCGTLNKKYKDLKKAYATRKNEYRKIVANQYSGKNEYIEDNDDIINSDRNIIIKFKEFIDELVRSKSKENGTKYGEEKGNISWMNEPLIFVFFDDVDISTNKCYEVLDTINKFLKHQNIIVFVSGDYSVFRETTTVEFLKKEGLLRKELLEQNFVYFNGERIENSEISRVEALERKKQLAQEFLKKVMPPTFRYEMPSLNNEQKSEFSYEYGGDTLNQLIETTFGVSMPTYYYDIFDSNVRGLINVYYSIWELYKNKVENKKPSEVNENDVNQILNVIIKSSQILNENEDIIKKYIYYRYNENEQQKDKKNKVIKKQNNYGQIILDYKYLELECDSLLLNEEDKNKNKFKIINNFIILIFLGEFISEILDGIRKNKIKSYDYNISVIINKLNENLLPNLNKEKEELEYKIFKDLEKNLSLTNLENLFDNKSEDDSDKARVNNGEDNYFEILRLDIDNFKGDIKKRNNENIFDRLVGFFDEIYFQDEKWVKNKVDYVYSSGVDSLNDKIYKEIEKDFVSDIEEFQKIASIIEENKPENDNLNIGIKVEKFIKRIKDELNNITFFNNIDINLEQLVNEKLDRMIKKIIEEKQFYQEFYEYLKSKYLNYKYFNEVGRQEKSRIEDELEIMNEIKDKIQTQKEVSYLIKRRNELHNQRLKLAKFLQNINKEQGKVDNEFHEYLNNEFNNVDKYIDGYQLEINKLNNFDELMRFLARILNETEISLADEENRIYKSLRDGKSEIYEGLSLKKIKIIKKYIEDKSIDSVEDFVKYIEKNKECLEDLNIRIEKLKNDSKREIEENDEYEYLLNYFKLKDIQYNNNLFDFHKEIIEDNDGYVNLNLNLDLLEKNFEGYFEGFIKFIELIDFSNSVIFNLNSISNKEEKEKSIYDLYKNIYANIKNEYDKVINLKRKVNTKEYKVYLEDLEWDLRRRLDENKFNISQRVINNVQRAFRMEFSNYEIYNQLQIRNRFRRVRDKIRHNVITSDFDRDIFYMLDELMAEILRNPLPKNISKKEIRFFNLKKRIIIYKLELIIKDYINVRIKEYSLNNNSKISKLLKGLENIKEAPEEYGLSAYLKSRKYKIE
ncbi:hypothetical protein KYB31_20180 [Clostridium felsineum]|uniref:hypothetical protein n=1 Tax=Clostridium felsineum TaxID=36839 RepID=UPI00214D6C14|nr:hypothetical protein [Clostridium felsineum]MCR3761298.1 hypothetical protein [Clostridium felsineum]